MSEEQHHFEPMQSLIQAVREPKPRSAAQHLPRRNQARIYHGVRDADGVAAVFVVPYKGDAYELPPRLELARHSPTGFEWGYAGSGPAQLALALLAHVAGDRAALDWYQDYKFDVLVGLPHEQWELTDAEVEAWLEQHMRKGERHAHG